MKAKGAIFLLIIPLLLAGCTATPQRTSPAPVVRSGSAPVSKPGPQVDREVDAGSEIYAYRAPVPTATRPVQSSAVVALLANADQQRQAGDLTAAVATVERALRIEPGNAHLWHKLASLRYRQERYHMVVDLAAKSNSLAVGEPGLMRDNWQLIARARRALGDAAGARAAERKVQEF